MQNVLYEMVCGEEKFLRKSLLASYAVIAKKNELPVTISVKMYLPRIYQQLMLYSNVDKLA